jgi:ABC-type bacteriocin/lantibiotic exporter with double-glycine peptidase domain
MQPDEHHDQRGGSWANWTVLRSVEDPTVIRQIGDTCGHCVIRMWLVQHGRNVDHATVARLLGHEGRTSPREVVRVINTILARNAVSDLLQFENDRLFALFHPHWWIAMIKEYGRPAHWVLVRGCRNEGELEVMDSADGTHYWVTWSEFDEYWTRVQVGYDG